MGTHAEDKACTREYIDHYFNSIYQKYGSRFKTLIQAHFAISNETQKVRSPLLFVGNCSANLFFHNNKKNQGVVELKNRIIEVALAQPYMPEITPNVYLSFIQQLKGTAVPFHPAIC